MANEYSVNQSDLVSVANAIREKGGTSETLVFPDGFVGAVQAIQAGGGGTTPGVAMKDVKFYDYDGTLVASYTLAEAQELTALPDGPAHDGLTFQGWNWSLEKINALIRPMNVGAMYITDDGKTRLKIRVWDTARSNVPLYFSQTVDNGVTIDWGDGSATETLAGTGNKNTTHQYTAAGDYTITLNPAGSCKLGLGNDSSSYCVMGSIGNNGKVYCNLLKDVEIGYNVKVDDYTFNSCYSLASITIPDGITSIGTYAFRSCYSLASITIPNGVTSINNYTFTGCYSLASITIPDGITSIGTYAFQNCNSLASITIPNGVTSISYDVFGGCYSLASITIPDGVTSINRNAFQNCTSLASITIPNGVTSISDSVFGGCTSLASITIPDGITSIGTYAFQNCNSLASITIPNGVTSIGNSAFNSCYSLASITIPNGVTRISDSVFRGCYSLASITIPNGVTSIGNSAFQNCYSLASITIPNGVTSIGNSAFNSCYSLASITIPNGVTSIGNSAFQNCYGVAEYHLKPTTPPTLSNTNAFANIPSDCVIYVPQGCLEAYQTATNWTTYASYMQEEPA